MYLNEVQISQRWSSFGRISCRAGRPFLLIHFHRKLSGIRKTADSYGPSDAKLLGFSFEMAKIWTFEVAVIVYSR